MLTELSIRDLALIEGAGVQLGSGLNAITGETGAGKSLLVGSLELLRGETPRGGAKEWVRTGSDEARVEGRFELSGDAATRLRAWLAEELPAIADELEDEGTGELELVLTRTLARAGRSRAYVNQRPVARAALARLAPRLIEIHGQNDHQGLLLPSEQLRLIDLFGGCAPQRERYQAERASWLEARERLRQLEASHADHAERLDLLRFQQNELAELDPRAGEAGELTEEREILRSAGDLGSQLGGVVEALSTSDDALCDRLQSVRHVVERWRERLPRLAAVEEDLASASIHLEEAAAGLSSLVDGVQADPARLEEVEERLAELERLARKHRTTPDALHDELERVTGELSELEHFDESSAERVRAVETARGKVEKAARALSKKRRGLVKSLIDRVEETLAALGLEHARLDVAFTARDVSADDEGFGATGHEDVELLLAANPGEEKQPLRRVASGGEAARIMLALRTVLSAGEKGRTLVFDEIDSGVGGRLGPEVGRHLQALGADHQVVCVTHLPAIAAAADLHLTISKEVKKGRTRTSIAPIEGEERVGEIADMIAGGADQKTARAEAKRLLTASRS